MTGCNISGNKVTGNAAGLHLELGEATLTGCTVTGNTATGVAGGILNVAGHLTLDDSHVTDNEAGSDGGVYIRDDLGATISIVGDTTICGNDAPQCFGFADSACQDHVRKPVVAAVLIRPRTHARPGTRAGPRGPAQRGQEAAGLPPTRSPALAVIGCDRRARVPR
ncbi:MAG: hypothetical protein U0075_14780 [Thermomicrobiales bacterium]